MTKTIIIVAVLALGGFVAYEYLLKPKPVTGDNSHPTTPNAQPPLTGVDGVINTIGMGAKAGNDVWGLLTNVYDKVSGNSD